MPIKQLESLDRHVDDGRSFRGNEFDPAEQAEQIEDLCQLRRLLTQLSPDTRRAIDLRFFRSAIYSEIGLDLDISREKARQLVETGLQVLRGKLNAS